MKYLYLVLLATALLPFAANAQFSEDFNSVPLTSGFGDVPAGWVLYDQDGLTPNSGVNFVDEAWVVAGLTDGNQVALSTSWYTPAGQSDDWMVTPEITVPATSPFLLFEAMALDAGFADDYEVLISTTGDTPVDFSTVIHSETAPTTSLVPVAVDLSTYAGQQVYIAFRNIGNDEYMLAIDNIEVLSLPDNDIAITNVGLAPYSVISTNNNLEVTLKNMGGNTITSVDIEWTDGTNTYTHNATGLNLLPYTSTTITHSTSVNYSSVVEKLISTTAINVNSGADPNLTDNTGDDKSFHTVSQAATKYVVIEEGTGTWCGWCPRGVVAMEHMYNNASSFPNFIGIAVHNGDPMTVSEYDSGAALSGFPGANVGRTIMGAPVSQTDWVDFYNARKDMISPADVSITAGYDETSREITASVTGNFYTNYALADLRLSVVVVEDNVTGTSSGYAQVNYYAGGANGAMGGFESLPDPVPAADMVYDRVGIALLGGYDGEAGSVPSAINDGDTANYSFTYTLPTDSDPAEIALVALLIDQNTGAILNASEVQLDGLGVAENPIALDNIEMYPNPTSEFVNVSFGMTAPANVRLNVYSMSGAVVKTQSYENLNGSQAIQVDVSSLAAGEYLVSLATEKGAVVKSIIVK